MQYVKVLVLFLLIGITNELFAQTPEPSKEHKLIGNLAGRWTLQGMEDRYLEICDIYEGGFFLVCNTEYKTKSGKLNKSVSVIGYSMEGKHITYYHYGSAGESQILKGGVDDNANFYFEGEEVKDSKLTKTRVSMTRSGENYNFKEETSTDNGPWTKSAEFIYVRLK